MPLVTFSSTFNRRALAAALIMEANADLSHDPPPTWKCWSADGHTGAQNSNLSGWTGAESVAEFVDDDGDLGHRRSVLDPTVPVYGTGSTANYNALYAGPSAEGALTPEMVAWPPAGDVPWPLIDEGEQDDEDWWSASFNVDGIDLTQANVEVTFDGFKRAATDVRRLEPGYGSGDALGWKVPLAASDRAGDATIVVTIKAPVNGVMRTFTPYEIRAFPMSETGPTPTPTPTPTPAEPEPAALRVTALKVKRNRLVARLSLNPLADGDAITLKLRGGGRTVTRSTTVRSGRASFRVPLTRRQRRAKLRAVFRYAGSDTVAPGTVRRKLRR